MLKADASEAGEGWSDSQIAEALDTSVDTVARTRQRLVEDGFEAAQVYKYSPASARPRIFDGAAERPFGGSEQARAINLASEAPSKMRVLAEAGECLRVSTASNPSSTSCWRVRAIVARLVFKALAIWLSLQASPASPASAFNRMRAFVNLWAGCLPLRIRLSSRSRSSALSFTTYFFTAISLAATNRLRQYVTEPSIRTFYSLSTTGGSMTVSCPSKCWRPWARTTGQPTSPPFATGCARVGSRRFR